MNNKLLIITILLIFSFSCKTKEKLIVKTDLPSKNELVAEVILDSLSKSELEYNTLYMKFSASMINAKGEMNTPGSIKIIRDSLIILSVTPMLGIELMRARITKNEIIVLNRLGKTYYLEDMENIHKLFGVSLSFSEIEKILTNKFFPYPDSLSIARDYKYSDYVENGQSFLRFLYAGNISDTTIYKHSIFIANTEKNYDSFSVDFSNLQKSVKAKYGNFKELNSINFPYFIKFEVLDGKYSTKLNIEFTKVERNKDLNFSFSIPKRYKKKKILSF